MRERVGRSVISQEPRMSKYAVKLSWFRSCLDVYFNIRLKLLERKRMKYGSYSGGYQLHLFNAYVYQEHSCMQKIEALYSKQELKNYKRRSKKQEKKYKKEVKYHEQVKVKPFKRL